MSSSVRVPFLQILPGGPCGIRMPFPGRQYASAMGWASSRHGRKCLPITAQVIPIFKLIPWFFIGIIGIDGPIIIASFYPEERISCRALFRLVHALSFSRRVPSRMNDPKQAPASLGVFDQAKTMPIPSGPMAGWPWRP